MKVLKPFNRGGQHYARGSAAPADLDKATIAHYRRHGMVTAEDAKAAEGSSTTSPVAPARKPRQPGSSETKPAGPTETKPAGPTETKPAAPAGAAAGDGSTSGDPTPTTTTAAGGEGGPDAVTGITSASLG
jgi:hypothetical protein